MLQRTERVRSHYRPAITFEDIDLIYHGEELKISELRIHMRTRGICSLLKQVKRIKNYRKWLQHNQDEQECPHCCLYIMYLILTIQPMVNNYC
jgi:hypothetical protein